MKKAFSMVGMEHRKTEALVKALQPGVPATLIRESTNRFDPNAIQVWIHGEFVAYIPKNQNALLAAMLDHPERPLDDAGSRSIEAVFIRSPNSGYPQVEVEAPEGTRL